MAGRQMRMPRSDLRMSVAPVELGEAEIQVRERASDGDMADAERRASSAVASCSSAVSVARSSRQRRRATPLRRLRRRARCATAAESSKPSPSAWRRSAVHRAGLSCWKQLRPGVQRVEIFADHDEVIERRAVVQHQCRKFAQRIVRQQPALGVFIATTVRTQRRRSTSPVSCANTITLRTNGDRGDQCSFMTRFRAHHFSFISTRIMSPR